MKTLSNLLAITLIAISFSCTDSDENTPAETTILSKTVEFSPQSVGFTSKFVTNYLNNKRANDTTYNNSGGFTQRNEYTYSANSRSRLRYNSANVLQNRYVYNYDSTNRIIGAETYDGQNVLIRSLEYEYQGHDIFVYKTENGVRELNVTYKTNNDNLLYFEQYANGTLKTLSYNTNYPTQLDHDGYVMPYEFYPTAKPVLRSTNEINSSVLSNLILDHMYYQCNYYLKKVTFPSSPDFYVNYTSEFDTDNYQTHLRTFTSDATGEQNLSETFFYYE